MICPQCNTENRLGAIFCRSCGGKLQIQDVSRENFEEKTGVKLKEGPKVGKIIRNVVILVLVLALAVAVFMMTRVPIFDKIATSDKALEEFDKKAGWIKWFKNNDYKYKVDISETELNSHISNSIKTIKKGPIEFKEVTIDLQGENRVAAWFSGKLKNFDIIFGVSGQVSVKGGKLDFTIESAKVGKLPLPSFLSGKVFDNMLSPSGEDQSLISSAESVVISDDKVTVNTKGSREYTPRRQRSR